MMEKNNDMKNQQKTNYYKKWEKFYNIVMFNQEKKWNKEN